MPIPLRCRCGKSFQAKDDQVGKHAFCPGCGVKHFVPPPESITSHPEPEAKPKTKSAGKPPATKTFRCEVCGGKFPITKVYDDDGEIICHDCYEEEEEEAAEDTGIEIKTWFLPLTFIWFLIPPTLYIDGERKNIGWFQTKFFPMRPGRYSVRIYVPYIFGPMGEARRNVTVKSDRKTSLTYNNYIWWGDFSGGSR